MVLKTLHPAKFFTPLLILLCQSLSADGQQQSPRLLAVSVVSSKTVHGHTQSPAAPAAGLRVYVTDFSFSNQTIHVQTLDIVFGNGNKLRN